MMKNLNVELPKKAEKKIDGLVIYNERPKKSVLEKLLWWMKFIAAVLVVCAAVMVYTAGYASASEYHAASNEPVRFCYLLEEDANGWTRWCTPDNALYNGKGYKVFDLEWLETPCINNIDCWENKNRWALWIINAMED
ncbi:MAG: hypothetical protein WC444_06975 [Candidatus Paceibacterota bacterium]